MISAAILLQSPTSGKMKANKEREISLAGEIRGRGLADVREEQALRVLVARQRWRSVGIAASFPATE